MKVPLDILRLEGGVVLIRVQEHALNQIVLTFALRLHWVSLPLEKYSFDKRKCEFVSDIETATTLMSQ